MGKTVTKKARKFREKFKNLRSERTNNGSSPIGKIVKTKGRKFCPKFIDQCAGTNKDVTSVDDDCTSTTRSTYSIPKAIKSILGVQTIPKKEKLKLRHDIFMRRFDIRRDGESSFRKTNTDSEDSSWVEEPTSTKTVSRPRRALRRLRSNKQLEKDLIEFRENLKNLSRAKTAMPTSCTTSATRDDL